MTTLKVTVISANKLPSVESFFKLDPICYVKFQGIKNKTYLLYTYTHMYANAHTYMHRYTDTYMHIHVHFVGYIDCSF